MVRPVPIPNTAVKHCKADGSGCIASARVGSRQSFKKAGEISPAFLFCALAFKPGSAEISSMTLPSEPVTLSVEQIRELNQKLSDLRHDVNNNIALMLSALEMIRRRPETVEKMLDSLSRQPQKVIDAVAQFSKNLETSLHITRP